jgi:hypothetical protein
MHKQHKIRRQDHKSICTYKSKVNACKHRHLVVPRITASRVSSGTVPRITAGRASSRAVEEVVDEIICRIIRATSEGYMMSKRVHRKVQSKVNSLESELAMHFPLAPVSLMKEWHQLTVIPKIRKVSTI